MDYLYYIVQYGDFTHRYWSCDRAVIAFNGLLRKVEDMPPDERPRLRLKKCLMTKNCGDKYKIHTTVLMERISKEEAENGIR